MMARVVILLVAIFGGAAFSQLPELAQQYRQRLGGALDELNRIVERFVEDARKESLTVEQALARLTENGDTLVRRQGASISDTMDRRDRLVRQRAAFEAAGPFMRIIAFVRDYDPLLVRGTLADFEPAVPITLEGVVLAGLGFLAGLSLGQAFRILWRRRRERGGAVPGPAHDRR